VGRCQRVILVAGLAAGVLSAAGAGTLASQTRGRPATYAMVLSMRIGASTEGPLRGVVDVEIGRDSARGLVLRGAFGTRELVAAPLSEGSSCVANSLHDERPRWLIARWRTGGGAAPEVAFCEGRPDDASLNRYWEFYWISDVRLLTAPPAPDGRRPQLAVAFGRLVLTEDGTVMVFLARTAGATGRDIRGAIELTGALRHGGVGEAVDRALAHLGTP